MAFKTTGVLATAILALALAGCQSERFSRVDTRGPSPAPLQAAPAGSVTAGQLPPPVQPGTTDPSQFPVAPGVDPNASQAPTQVAAAPSGPAITTGSVAGVWNASVGGQSCRIATPQTRFGQGFRAGPLRCPAPLDGVKSWNVSGSQLALYNDNGEILARLSSTGGERFDGQTSSGQQVSLSR